MSTRQHLSALLGPVLVSLAIQFLLSWREYRNPFDAFLGLACGVAVQVILSIGIQMMMARRRPTGGTDAIASGLWNIVAGVLLVMVIWAVIFTQRVERRDPVASQEPTSFPILERPKPLSTPDS